MLMNLQVRDFAIVDRIDIEFEAGMSVLTGETGAGKSILVDALGLVLGERGSAQLVRNGAKRAEFTAEFDVSGLESVRVWLEEMALDREDECLLRRVISADGRSRAFINGNPVPLSQLKGLGELLLDIHGQHFHQSLGRRSIQRDLLFSITSAGCSTSGAQPKRASPNGRPWPIAYSSCPQRNPIAHRISTC
jgi:DNA repair protein RecN (Recombination protein N)